MDFVSLKDGYSNKNYLKEDLKLVKKQGEVVPNIVYRITLTTQEALETWDDSLEKCRE